MDGKENLELPQEPVGGTASFEEVRWTAERLIGRRVDAWVEDRAAMGVALGTSGTLGEELDAGDGEAAFAINGHWGFTLSRETFHAGDVSPTGFWAEMGSLRLYVEQSPPRPKRAT